MAYGSVKVDSLIYDNSGSDVTLSVSGIPSASDLNAKAPLANPTFTGDIKLNAQAPVKFMDADSSHYVGLRGPGAITTNVVWTLPSADGSQGQLLKTDGNGNLGWATDQAGAGGASIGLALALG